MAEVQITGFYNNGSSVSFNTISGGTGISLDSGTTKVTLLNSLVAENGLTRINGKVKLGGSVTGNTNISLGTNILSLTGTSSSVKTTDLFISNQVSTGSNLRPLYIDNTGKLQKSGFINLDETGNTITVTGIDDLDTSINAEFLNDSLQSIMGIYNDQHVQFGGATFIISVLDGISSGAAYIEMNTGQTQALKINDKSGNTYISFNSTISGSSINFTKPLKYNHNLGFEKKYIQAKITTSTTAGAKNIISSVAIPTDYAIVVEVNHLFAYATNSWTVIATGEKENIIRNSGGTVSGDTLTYTVASVPLSTTATWEIAANDSTKKVDINFYNTTGSGNTFDVFLDYTYILVPLPVVA